MKKLLILAAIVGGVAFVLKRNADAKAEADLWREATAPSDLPTGVASPNGSTAQATTPQAPASEN